MSLYIAYAACGGITGGLYADAVMGGLFIRRRDLMVTSGKEVEQTELGIKVQTTAFGVMRAHHFGMGVGMVVGTGVALAGTTLAGTTLASLAMFSISCALIGKGLMLTFGKAKEIFNEIDPSASVNELRSHWQGPHADIRLKERLG